MPKVISIDFNDRGRNIYRKRDRACKHDQKYLMIAFNCGVDQSVEQKTKVETVVITAIRNLPSK